MKRSPRRRVIRLVGTLAATVFAATAVVALATDNLHPAPKNQALTTNGGTIGPVVANPTAPTSLGGQPIGASPVLAAPSASSAVTGSTTAGTGVASPSNPSAPGAKPNPGTGGSKSVAVASGLLKITAFGSRTGLPLLCGVVLGGLGPVLTNQTVSKLAATIGSSCVKFGASGSVALLGLNDQLAALRAANPALDPAITAFANFFNTVGSQPGVPFGSSAVALGYLILFFTG